MNAYAVLCLRYKHSAYITHQWACRSSNIVESSRRHSQFRPDLADRLCSKVETGRRPLRRVQLRRKADRDRAGGGRALMDSCIIPTLKLESCPYGHGQDCKKEWQSPATGHKISCGCPCHATSKSKKGRRAPPAAEAQARQQAGQQLGRHSGKGGASYG